MGSKEAVHFNDYEEGGLTDDDSRSSLTSDYYLDRLMDLDKQLQFAMHHEGNKSL